jgi:hypothetical protein
MRKIIMCKNIFGKMTFVMFFFLSLQLIKNGVL